jgi:hypothetical protein
MLTVSGLKASARGLLTLLGLTWSNTLLTAVVWGLAVALAGTVR